MGTWDLLVGRSGTESAVTPGVCIQVFGGWGSLKSFLWKVTSFLEPPLVGEIKWHLGSWAFPASRLPEDSGLAAS